MRGAEITVTSTGFEDNDYISLTDMLKAKDGDFFISEWLRNRNTLEFVGVWEKMYNPKTGKTIRFLDMFRRQFGAFCHLAPRLKKRGANVSEHIKHIFDEGELEENAVVRNSRTTAADGKKYNMIYYIDVIISLGNRLGVVRSFN